MAVLIGTDLGTSSLKILLINTKGEVLSMASRAYQFDSPHPGYAQQDPEVWWEAFCESLKEAIKKADISREEIKGIGFSGQMHGLVMLDKNLRSVRPAILHCDTRSAEQVRMIREKLSEAGVRELMMNSVYCGFMLPSLLWVREKEKENYERIAHILFPKDYLRMRLTGIVCSDYSDASASLMFDLKKGEWSKEIMEAFEIPLSMPAKCFGTAERTGSLTKEAAQLTGLPRPLAVAAGGGDQVMQGIGNGITGMNRACLNIGSSAQLSFQSKAPLCNPALSTNTFCGYEKNRWIVMGAMMSAGLSMQWCMRLLGKTDYQGLNEAVAKVAPGSGGVIFLPYLNGERTPHMNPDISGAFLGLNLHTGAPELARSVMEGVVFALCQCMELCREMGLEARDYLISSGGGAKSEEWLQMQSDIFHMPIRIAAVQEQACLGAAIAAGVGAGIYADIEEGCAALVRYEERICLPESRRHERYMEYYQIFKEAYPANASLLNRLTLLGREGMKQFGSE